MRGYVDLYVIGVVGDRSEAAVAVHVVVQAWVLDGRVVYFWGYGTRGFREGKEFQVVGSKACQVPHTERSTN